LPVFAAGLSAASRVLGEISANAQSFYTTFERASFGPEDERPLLAEVDQGDWPVVRLSRWPGGAQCALAITGDVDAFTLWITVKGYGIASRVRVKHEV